MPAPQCTGPFINRRYDKMSRYMKLLLVTGMLIMASLVAVQATCAFTLIEPAPPRVQC